MHKLGVAGQVKSFQMNQQNINLVCFQYYIGFQLLQLKYLLNSKLLPLRWSVYILLHHSTSSHSKHYTSGDNKARVCLICCFPIAQLWLDWQHCCLVINNGAHHDGVTFKWIICYGFTYSIRCCLLQPGKKVTDTQDFNTVCSLWSILI